MSHRPKHWNVAEPHPAALELAARLKTSPLVARMLINRGMEDPLDCANFLRPSLKFLHDPALIPNLTAAAARVARAIKDQELVCVYGDYDVDGITATSILWHAIKLLGGRVRYYIPHRIDEGYGLNADAIAQIINEGATLILTVDCGITALEQAKVARERGVDLIITDHHEYKIADCGLRIADLGEENDTAPAAIQSAIRNPQSAILPDCFAVVHPRLPGSVYPNPHLCGAGVAFKLAWGIGQAVIGAARVSEAFKQYLMEATALAALGTIADVVPLVGENRVLAHFGLGGLKESKLTGIRALIDNSNLTGMKLDSYDVGFKLAPRLNACGRMGHARLAVEMLTDASIEKASEIALYLEKQNRDRQTLEKKILDAALTQVDELHMAEDDCRGVVLGAEGWHPGVIGIVASRVVDRLHKPAVMVALNDGVGQGSARSIPGFHLARALDACTRHLKSHGGHEMAAGLKMDAAHFEDFRHAFAEYACSKLSADQLVPRLQIDTLAELNQMTEALVKDLARLGPFGHGNRKPLLACRDLEIASVPRRVGKTGDHLQLFLRQGKAQMKAIAFNYGDLFDKLTVGTRINLAVEPTLNEFNGRTNVELGVKDLQFANES